MWKWQFWHIIWWFIVTKSTKINIIYKNKDCGNFTQNMESDWFWCHFISQRARTNILLILSLVYCDCLDSGLLRTIPIQLCTDLNGTRLGYVSDSVFFQAFPKDSLTNAWQDDLDTLHEEVRYKGSRILGGGQRYHTWHETLWQIKWLWGHSKDSVQEM